MHEPLEPVQEPLRPSAELGRGMVMPYPLDAPFEKCTRTRLFAPAYGHDCGWGCGYGYGHMAMPMRGAT